ncbi:MAG: hypothetical protein L3J24_05155 [Xanthomonadales bacterium]|nr:hypothetical protein [Xanthomonadales bacterium]
MQVYGVLNDWLGCCSPTSHTLEEFANHQADPLLSTELLVIAGHPSITTKQLARAELLRALKKARGQLKQADTEASNTHLQSLNPV